LVNTPGPGNGETGGRKFPGASQYLAGVRETAVSIRQLQHIEVHPSMPCLPPQPCGVAGFADSLPPAQFA
jgi:hypothetical protein